MIPVILFAIALVAYPASFLAAEGTYVRDGLKMLASFCGIIAICVAAIVIPLYAGVAAFRWSKSSREPDSRE